MRTLEELSPTEFENLTYDILQLAGMQTLVWRTPGADGGRDIEGIFPQLDFSGHYNSQPWYIECKRYSSSIDWPTVWKKISYAESRNARFLLLVTNNNPSPACETEIANWNSDGRRVVVRVWRGYEFGRLLRSYPAAAAKYGLSDDTNTQSAALIPILLEAMKAAQTSYVAHEFGGDIRNPLEAGAALAELISARMDQLKNYGQFLGPTRSKTPPTYDWLRWNGPSETWDEAGVRAFITAIHRVTYAKVIEFDGTDSGATIKLQSARFTIDAVAQKNLSELAMWADIEISKIGATKIAISARKPI